MQSAHPLLEPDFHDSWAKSGCKIPVSFSRFATLHLPFYFWSNPVYYIRQADVASQHLTVWELSSLRQVISDEVQLKITCGVLLFTIFGELITLIVTFHFVFELDARIEFTSLLVAYPALPVKLVWRKFHAHITLPPPPPIDSVTLTPEEEYGPNIQNCRRFQKVDNIKNLTTNCLRAPPSGFFFVSLFP